MAEVSIGRRFGGDSFAPLAQTNLNELGPSRQSKYDFNYRTFPEDLSSDYNGHYMIININVPTNSVGKSISGINGSGSFSSSVLPNDLATVDRLKFGSYRGIDPTNVPIGGIADVFNPRADFTTGTRRIIESIAIHMPSSVLYNSQHIYEEVSLTAIAGSLGKVVASTIGATVAGLLTRSVANGLATGSAINRVYNPLGSVVGTGAKLLGYPINPRVEVLFTATPQRQFAFEILMAPKSEKESETMKKIVETLRFHAAPEISSLTLGNIAPVLNAEVLNLIGNAGIPLFIPPAMFDISFYNKGGENTNIPRISTCVMERIEVDYAPTGVYSTFRNGHPVVARLSMGFREVEILHKARIAQGY